MKNLQDINNNKPIPTIYFSETDRILQPSTFNNLTNYSEYMEVMGKVIYIISEFIKNNQQYIRLDDSGKKHFIYKIGN